MLPHIFLTVGVAIAMHAGKKGSASDEDDALTPEEMAAYREKIWFLIDLMEVEHLEQALLLQESFGLELVSREEVFDKYVTKPTLEDLRPQSVEWILLEAYKGAGFEHVTELDISERVGYKKIPDGVQYLTNLKFLNVSYSYDLTELPSWIGKLVNLEKLYLSDTSISDLPLSMRNLKKLDTLLLSSTVIDFIPNGLKGLPIRRLAMSNTEMSALPERLLWFKNTLESFECGANNILMVRSWIGRLTKLKSLNLFANNMGSLPSSIGNLKNLEDLQVGLCPIRALPETLKNCTQLSFLDISQTNIQTFPKALFSLKKLKTLYASDAPFMKRLSPVEDMALAKIEKVVR